MRYYQRLSIFLGLDILIICVSIYCSYLFRFTGNIPTHYLTQILYYIVISTVFCTSIMFVFRLYNRIWLYASVDEMLEIIKAVVIGNISSYILTYLILKTYIPSSIVILSFETMLISMGGTRFIWRVYKSRFQKNPSTLQRTLIIGAGKCGLLIAKELKQSKRTEMQIVGFIDDAPEKHRLHVYGLPVFGGRSQINKMVEKHFITDIIIAMPSISKVETSLIIEICKQSKVKLKIVPSIEDFINGKVTLNNIRDVELEDLLGREPVKVNWELASNNISNKIVLVTGAGGSIGSELCRQVAQFNPSKLIMLDHYENSIYSIDSELRGLDLKFEIISVIVDIQDRERLDWIFSAYRPEVVFHAAAHKHVPLMECNPSAAIMNNIFGTKNVAECADNWKVERFVLISTDKAVNPTSIMGATKRVAEMIVQCLGQSSQTKFTAVRFGNVLGSNGSVIPRFKQQIAMGGPITITHPDMIRYFMTIPEAAQLVIQSSAYAENGEIMVLDMGKPIRILDLAKDLITLSGLKPDEIKIEFTGIRPGEKLYEDLLTDEEGLNKTTHERILIGKPITISRSELEYKLKKLEKCIYKDSEVIKEVIRSVLPTYQNQSQIEEKIT